MILDKSMELAASMPITATAATPNQLDLGKPIWTGSSAGSDDVQFLITAKETGVGAGTVAFQLRSSPNADMSSAVVLEQSRDILATDIVIGKEVPFFPDVDHTAQQYVDINVIVSGTVTAGKVQIIGTTSRQTNG